MLSDEAGDLGERPVVERLGLPDPGAVDVQRHPELPRGLGREPDQVVPRREQAAGVAQRQLDQRRAEARGQAAQVVAGGRVPALGEVLEAAARAASRGPSSSWMSRWDRSGMATRPRRLRSHQTRSIDCWAIVPLTKNTAAGLPSSSATCSSSSSTAPPSAYMSHSSMPSSSQALRQPGEHLGGRGASGARPPCWCRRGRRHGGVRRDRSRAHPDACGRCPQRDWRPGPRVPS